MNERNTNSGREHSYRVGAVVAAGGTNVFNRISWGAIFAGAIITLVAMLVLNLLGIGIGMGTIDPTEEARPFSGLGTGAIIWWVVSNLLAIFAGAYVAGKLSGVPLRSTSTMHGILSWCLYTLISFYILTTAVGSLLSGVGSIISGTLSAAGSGIEKVTSGGQQQSAGQDRSSMVMAIENEVQKVLSPQRNSALVPDSIENIAANTARDVRQNLTRQQVENIVQDAFFENGQFAENVTREDVVNAIHRNTTLSQQEVNNVADTIYRHYEQAKRKFQEFKVKAEQQARETGEQVAEATSSAAIWTFVALVLGAIVAGAGGAVARPETLPTAGAEARVREE